MIVDRMVNSQNCITHPADGFRNPGSEAHFRPTSKRIRQVLDFAGDSAAVL